MMLSVHATRRSTKDSPDPVPTGGARMAAVDGLRALAVALVVAFHLGAPLSGGFLGVDLFFVISGFVISRLLLGEIARTGRIRYRTFLARRIRRLLPLLLTVLVTVQIWMLLSGQPALQRAGDRETVAAAAYVSNWYAIFAEQSYWDIHTAETPLNHLWSLAVEEQFYFVWPFLLLLLVRWLPRKALLWALAALAMGSYLLAFALGQSDWQRAYEGTDTRAGALLLGAALAVALHGREPKIRAWIAGAVGVGALAMLLVLSATVTIDGSFLFAGGLAIAGILELALVWSATSAGVIERVFAAEPVRVIGRMSYSIYLWHWVVWVALGTATTLTQGWRALVTVVLTLALSALSYRFIERRFQHSESRAVVVVSLVGLVAVGVFAAAVCPPPPTGG